MTEQTEETEEEVPFTKEELVEIQLLMASIFRQINVLPLDKVIKAVDNALTIGQFIDPTLFIQKGKDAGRWLRIAKMFRTCRNDIRKEFE